MFFPNISLKFNKDKIVLSRFLLSLISLFFAQVSQAQFGGVVLAWDQNPEPTISGYRIYFGVESGSYDQVIDVGNQTQVDLRNLALDETYFAVVSAYDEVGVESPLSSELSFQAEIRAPIEIPVSISGFEMEVENGVPTMKVVVSGDLGASVTLLVSDDLKQWDSLGEHIIGAESAMISDSQFDHQESRFYRLTYHTTLNR